MWRWWFRQDLATQIFVGMVVGILMGLANSPIRQSKGVGDLFIRLIRDECRPRPTCTHTSLHTEPRDTERGLQDVVSVWKQDT
jgi:hypothetical protein